MKACLSLAFIAMMSLVMTSSHASPATLRKVHLREDAIAGFVVARTRSILHIQKANSEFHLLRQKLLSPNPNAPVAPQPQKWMDLNVNTGTVTLRHRVDREEMCGDAQECIIHLQIFVVDSQQLLNLHVIIDDVNDNAPQFPKQNVIVNVTENAMVGDMISLDQYLSQDADIGKNSMITYMISPNNFFQLEQYEDETKTLHLQLKLLQKLDYERNNIQRLTLTAQDGGIPPQTTHVQLQVRITDVNDNDPVFEETEYSVTMEENVIPGHVIAHMVAHDADSGDSGVVRYFVSRRNKNAARHLVDIDPVTGAVTLKQNLDREMHDRVRVLIEARDLGLTNQRVGLAWLSIRVEDVNDNAPVISISFLRAFTENTVYLQENSPPGTYLAHVTAKDADMGMNGKVRIFIQSVVSQDDSDSSYDETFVFTPDGFLNITKSLDREKKDRFTIVMKACDSGSRKQCTSEVISVILLDVNEHAPIFSHSNLDFKMSEDTALGTILTTVHATDDDAINPPALTKNENGDIVTSSNGDVTYHVIDGDGTFSVDRTTGKIRLDRALDRERVERYQISVLAKDGGRPIALESTCIITIKISDVNDNAPHFTIPGEDNYNVYATILRDDVIMRVQAVDYDEGASGSVRYKIISEDGVVLTRDSLTSLFVIGTSSGDLRLNLSNPTIKNSMGTHRLVVQAQDKGVIPLHSTRAIQVTVTDLVTLPTVPPKTSKVASSSSSLVVIVAALSASLILLLLATLAVVFKCRKDSRQTRTYSCRKVSVDSGEWGHASVVSMKKSPEPRRAISKDSDVSKGSEVWGQSFKKRSDLYTGGSYTDIGNTSHSDVMMMSRQSRSSFRSSGRPSAFHNTSSVGSKHSLFDKAASIPQVAISSHDGDSGRGDSDPDVAGSDITYDHDFSKSPGRSSSNDDARFHSMESSRCTPQCLLYGHSDNCWMPSPDEEPRYQPQMHYNDPSASSPLYVELCPSNQMYAPDHPNLETIPETRPLRHFWSYPANDLSSIYSNVIMNSQRQDSFHVRFQQANQPQARHSDVAAIQSPTRLSPISSVSSPASPNYADASTKLLRHDVEPDDASKRSTISLFSPSSPRHHALARSASADLLANSDASTPFIPTSRNIDACSPVEDAYNSRGGDYGNVSMRETEEIVENIERLLSS